MKPQKLKSLKIDNFGAMNGIFIEFDNEATYLVGVNGSGKSTAMNAIHACFAGISEKGPGYFHGNRFKIIGPNGATAKLELTLFDENTGATVTLTRTVMKSGNSPITLKTDQELSSDWFNDFFRVCFFSAKNWQTLTGPEQALELGIDVSKFRKKMATKKQEYTEINAHLRALGRQSPVEEVEPVDVSKLIQERDEIHTFNQTQNDRSFALNQANAHIKELEHQRDQILAELDKREHERDSLPAAEPLKDTVAITEQIANAESTNGQARAYQTYQDFLTQSGKYQKQLTANKAEQSDIEREEREYMASFKFPFDNLSVDEETGALLCDGREIREPYVSYGELVEKVALLNASRNPKFKVVWVDNAEGLDEERRKSLQKKLNDKGFQVIFNMVGKRQQPGEYTVLLKEGKIVDSYENKSNKL